METGIAKFLVSRGILSEHPALVPAYADLCGGIVISGCVVRRKDGDVVWWKVVYD
jgi:hypothetical protein